MKVSERKRETQKTKQIISTFDKQGHTTSQSHCSKRKRTLESYVKKHTEKGEKLACVPLSDVPSNLRCMLATKLATTLCRKQLLTKKQGRLSSE